MEKRYKINYVISIALIVIAFIANGFCLFGQMNTQFTYILVHLVNIIALVCACIYLMGGTSKEYAIWLKFFEISLAAAYLVAVLRYAIMPHSPIVLMLTVVGYGFVTSLFNVDNIGKKRSFALCLALLLIEALTIIIGIVSHQGSLTRYVSTGSRAIMVVILFLLIDDKYYDKILRGRKV